jgi:N-methylhydantoinase B
MTQTIDPITFSIIRHRFYRIVEEAVITLKHVSGSAITNEGHDLMVSLYEADGTLLLGGAGYLHHLTSAAEACKSIIRRFENDINEGDLFLLNDPFTAALHTSDIYLISPIHHEGKLIAWSACFVHVYDIGAMNPGGFAPDAVDVFSEGFSSPGLKLIDRGNLREDVWDTLLNMVRGPEMVALDLRSMIACNNVAKDRMLALVSKYGIVTVKEASKVLIEQSEKLLRERLRELPDGSWQSRQYFEVKGEIYKVLLKMTKKDDELLFDFTGSSPQSKYAVNCTKWASLGGLFAPLFPLLCYDITWNEGVIRPIKVIAPEGSIVNCTKPSPVSVATVGAIQSVNNAACSTIAKMLATTDKYFGQSSAVWHANHFAVFMFGKNQRGSESIGILTETFAGAGGARTFADGVDIGGEIPNPISRMANVETVEAMFPIRYLFRRRLKDSGGGGKFRGGTGGEIAIVAHDAPDGGIHYVLSGKGSKFPQSEGLLGGNPGSNNDYVWVHSDESKNSRPYFSQELSSIPGNKEAITWGVFPLLGNDALYICWNGGGGTGDPLERDPDAVLLDYVNDIISIDAVKQIYGVVLLEGKINLPESMKLRAKMRTQIYSVDKKIKELKSSTTIIIDKHICCANCDFKLTERGKPWKSAAKLEILEFLKVPGSTESVNLNATLRQFLCPSCGSLLDTETALPDDPYLEDILE